MTNAKFSNIIPDPNYEVTEAIYLLEFEQSQISLDQATFSAIKEPLLKTSSSNVTLSNTNITNIDFKDTKSKWLIEFFKSNFTISSTHFVGVESSEGATMYLLESEGSLNNIEFDHNKAEGVYSSHSTLNILASSFHDNEGERALRILDDSKLDVQTT